MTTYPVGSECRKKIPATHLHDHYRDGVYMAGLLLRPGRESPVVLDRYARSSWAGCRSGWGRNPFYRAYHLGVARTLRNAGYGR